MIQIETVLGYGFHISHSTFSKIKLNYHSLTNFQLEPMCKSCGQSPYFFGLKLQKINSKEPYIEFNFDEKDIKWINDEVKNQLIQDYNKIFNSNPPSKPTFLMFTDMKIV